MRTAGRLKEIRSSRGLTQTDITIKTYLPQSAISAIENGRRYVGIKTAAKIAKALELSVEEVFPGLAANKD